MSYFVWNVRTSIHYWTERIIYRIRCYLYRIGIGR